MNFVSIRIITDDVKRLVDFYAQVTGATPAWATDQFAEIVTASGTLAVAHSDTIALFGAGAAHAADNHSVIVEFRVADVDRCYDTVRSLGAEVVVEPTTQPWGNRSLLFRDPDGNLVNFFTPVTAEAIRRQAR
ncbi:VOC family protein [Streptantibioticus cattleyicolor]|uniref:VOC domain-containing protein n=1 Tax=Streptantibioticus cattleyicolor (strain ATCC 35852 / DSM 46488 / JCM 4925 / NBRC 14057 / NRRL 8057) TaxID=1003195 RepID=F8JMZ9_STREN|nr:VOC family protein [Streptantibioticus cattleyicolor]AEW98427.1 hypothetical protein SCATT_p02340 [Streptantibioticus cattleyicolor NRRL 8057 = DSM 46488]CCB72516.1 conserved protein of unknown function [Streptantibioticus cattleyicolor NRRL 8057 = DSM 46488]